MAICRSGTRNAEILYYIWSVLITPSQILNSSKFLLQNNEFCLNRRMYMWEKASKDRTGNISAHLFIRNVICVFWGC